jgi:nucleotidyltransferase/DNA polymerase involved in DNA repair
MPATPLRPATRARLATIGATTIGQLAESSPKSVEQLLGHAVGRPLTALAWNRDLRQIHTRRRARSAGAQSALGRQPAIRAQTGQSMRSASVSANKRSITGQRREGALGP